MKKKKIKKIIEQIPRICERYPCESHLDSCPLSYHGLQCIIQSGTPGNEWDDVYIDYIVDAIHKEMKDESKNHK